MEIARNTPADRQIIQSYRTGGFTVAGASYDGAILVLPTATAALPVRRIDEIDGAALVATLRAASVSLCLIGCGSRMELVPPGLRALLKDAAIGIDAMETGAACRTYNMLAGEGRAVAAALIPR